MGKSYDVIIIGGGPAGLTAGMYCARARLNTLLLEKAFAGGQIVNAERVDNYPGFPEGIAGFDLVMLMQQQAEKYGLQIAYSEVMAVESRDRYKKVVTTTDGTYEAKALIIAGGAEHNHLGVPGEEEHVGRGVSYCATCDGAFYRDQVVAIVGGGDSAVVEAISLTKFAAKVYVIHRRDQLRASKIVQEQAFASSKIEFVWDSVVEAIEGEAKVERLKVKNVKTEEYSYLDVAAVFVSIGLHPYTEYLGDVVSLNNEGYVVTDGKLETEVPGIFAAGDGAAAAIYAERFIAGL